MTIARRFAGLLGSASLIAAQLASTMPVYAAGSFSNLPVVGGPAYCSSYIGSPTGQTSITGTGGGTGSGAVCASTTPAGPSALTGEELLQADIPSASLGGQPLTAAVPASVLAGSVNKLYGGDLDTALSQRLSTTKGIASLAGVSPTAAIMANDGFWLINQSSEATVTIASGTTEALPALNTTHAVRIARPSGQSPTTKTCVGQTLDIPTSAAFLGNNAIFSFYGLNGATMSAANGAITASISYSSGTAAAAQATLGYAGSQGSKYALGATGQAGTPTNWTVATPVLSPATTGSVATSGVVTIPMSTTWGRYSFAAPIPTVIPGTTTAVTDVSVSICANFTATTSVTTDWIELQGLQLEAKPSTVTAALPNGVVSPSAFAKREAAFEQQIEYYYWFYLFEDQALAAAYGSCENTSTSVANCFVSYPVPMRITPVVKWTDGFQVFAQVGETSVSACTSLGYSASLATVGNNKGFLMNCTATVGAAGTANHWMSLGTSSATGIIVASALP